ncbi:D-alanyl-D-alanine carboxypeptidase [Roseibium aestuarii]|uniref:D-alanyl-D-alanine carboxypeptidase n=1 Tax=Roseibium aestuarii TaxID=2600299 RepID=A0ABW4JY45_9HYPH|nr:D-alanyl-D-alanine carboxypeptidase [Roseibium aestuarii]
MIRVRHTVGALALSGLMALGTGVAQANSKYAGIVVDAKTGKTLYANSADSKRYPASLTKMMTLYVVFEELEAGRLSLKTPLKVSKYAAGRPPSKLGLKPGSTIAVEDAILALVTKSANDVAATVAENIGGSEVEFAKRMTRTARQIGMKNTVFRNPHGLPNDQQYTTARDMATLGQALQDRFPRYYTYFDTRVFTYRGARYGNHNKLLGRVKGVDGIKTGYTRASGFNLVTNVERDGRHIVAVVMGGTTGRARDAQMVELINAYLPKASKGSRTREPIMASTAPVETAVTAALSNVPLPGFKPDLGTADSSGPMVLALAEPAPSQVDPAAILTGTVPVPPQAVQTRLDSSFEVAGLALPPVPGANPAADTGVTAAVPAAATLTRVAVQSGAAPAQPVAVASLVPAPIPPAAIEDEGDTSGDTDTVATNNSPAEQPSWQIQIAAAESESGAIKMLKKVQATHGPALRGTVPVTEEVASGGQTLYRARFAGFDSKSQAWAACKTLKRSKVACYAIYQ